MTAQPDDLLEHIAARRAAGQPVALATVLRTWGSALRPVGSQLAVDAGGAGVGSISAGCIDGAVVEVALAVIADGRPRLQEFGSGEERAREMGLACGGRVQVYVERIAETGPFDRLLAAYRAQRPVALVTRLADGAQTVCEGDDPSEPSAGQVESPAAVMPAGGRTPLPGTVTNRPALTRRIERNNRAAGDLALPQPVLDEVRAASPPTAAGRWMPTRVCSSAFMPRRRGCSSSAPCTSPRPWRPWPSSPASR